MPLYEYECDACGHRFELIQKLSDPPPDKCPECGRPKLHKVQSAPAFQFKGSGWYVTDYARKDSGRSAKSDGAGADASKDSKDKSAKDKPAEKTEKAASSEKPADKSTSAKP
jgi:putative FmdB family regulatory protein